MPRRWLVDAILAIIDTRFNLPEAIWRPNFGSKRCTGNQRYSTDVQHVFNRQLIPASRHPSHFPDLITGLASVPLYF